MMIDLQVLLYMQTFSYVDDKILIFYWFNWCGIVILPYDTTFNLCDAFNWFKVHVYRITVIASNAMFAKVSFKLVLYLKRKLNANCASVLVLNMRDAQKVNQQNKSIEQLFQYNVLKKFDVSAGKKITY